MRKLSILISRSGDKWSVYSPSYGSFDEWLCDTKRQAYRLKRYAQAIYKLGRMDEYKDNVANAQKLMEKFGL